MTDFSVFVCPPSLLRNTETLRPHRTNHRRTCINTPESPLANAQSPIVVALQPSQQESTRRSVSAGPAVDWTELSPATGWPGVDPVADLLEVDSAADWLTAYKCRTIKFSTVAPSCRNTHKCFVQDFDLIVGLPHSSTNIGIVQGKTCDPKLALGDNCEFEAASQYVNTR